jgi:hypothetical protein
MALFELAGGDLVENVSSILVFLLRPILLLRGNDPTIAGEWRCQCRVVRRQRVLTGLATPQGTTGVRGKDPTRA